MNGCNMISYKTDLRLTLFFGKWWYTNMFTNSYIQVSKAFTITKLAAESKLKLKNNTRIKIFGNPTFEMKVLT